MAITKVELQQLVTQLTNRAVKAEREAMEWHARCNDLSDRLTENERRRLNEGNGYRRLLRKQATPARKPFERSERLEAARREAMETGRTVVVK